MLALVFSSSCRTTKQMGFQEIIISDFTEDKIGFLVFEISRNPKLGKSSINLTQTTIVDGKIKPHSPTLDEVSKLIFTLKDEDKNTNTYLLEHPLFKRMEHSHEENGLSSQTVELLNAEFFMRLPLKDKSRYLTISESIEGSEPVEIITYKFVKK